jgi:hypothetical protein
MRCCGSAEEVGKAREGYDMTIGWQVSNVP